VLRDVRLSVPGKVLSKLPKHVLVKLHLWITFVGEHGLDEVRKIPGYHDEPLSGVRIGQRSIRLNKTYRAFYRIETNTAEFVDVFDVNAHKY
jgi:toxin HigB-1